MGEAALTLRRESEQPTTRRTQLLAPLAPRPFTGTPPASAARRDAPGGAGPSAAVMSAATTTRYPASAGWATSGAPSFTLLLRPCPRLIIPAATSTKVTVAPQTLEPAGRREPGEHDGGSSA